MTQCGGLYLQIPVLEQARLFPWKYSYGKKYFLLFTSGYVTFR